MSDFIKQLGSDIVKQGMLGTAFKYTQDSLQDFQKSFAADSQKQAENKFLPKQLTDFSASAFASIKSAAEDPNLAQSLREQRAAADARTNQDILRAIKKDSEDSLDTADSSREKVRSDKELDQILDQGSGKSLAKSETDTPSESEAKSEKDTNENSSASKKENLNNNQIGSSDAARMAEQDASGKAVIDPSTGKPVAPSPTSDSAKDSGSSTSTNSLSRSTSLSSFNSDDYFKESATRRHQRQDSQKAFDIVTEVRDALISQDNSQVLAGVIADDYNAFMKENGWDSTSTDMAELEARKAEVQEGIEAKYGGDNPTHYQEMRDKAYEAYQAAVESGDIEKYDANDAEMDKKYFEKDFQTMYLNSALRLPDYLKASVGNGHEKQESEIAQSEQKDDFNKFKYRTDHKFNLGKDENGKDQIVNLRQDHRLGHDDVTNYFRSGIKIDRDGDGHYGAKPEAAEDSETGVAASDKDKTSLPTDTKDDKDPGIAASQRDKTSLPSTAKPFQSAEDRAEANKDLDKDTELINKSPILLDLDNDGLELTSIDDGTKFDVDADGKDDNTAWTAEQGENEFDDAFLVNLGKDELEQLKEDGSFQADGSHLFGDEGGKYKDGYEKLKLLDDNNDGKIDKNDAAYDSLKLWADKDKDGKIGEGEMRTLAEMGVASISTEATGTVGDEAGIDEHGNDLNRRSSFTREDGSEGSSTDVFLATKSDEAVNTEWSENTNASEANQSDAIDREESPETEKKTETVEAS